MNPWEGKSKGWKKREGGLLLYMSISSSIKMQIWSLNFCVSPFVKRITAPWERWIVFWETQLDNSKPLSLVRESALSHNAKHLFFSPTLWGLHDWLKEPLYAANERSVVMQSWSSLASPIRPPTANLLPPPKHTQTQVCQWELSWHNNTSRQPDPPADTHSLSLDFTTRQISSVSRSLPHVFPLMRSWVALYPCSLEKHSAIYGIYIYMYIL